MPETSSYGASGPGAERVRGLLALPAEHGARRVALDLLDEAADAARRLNEPDDDEALHDFRVALRRLRTWLGVFRVQLSGEALERRRRRIGRLARATAGARDAEVQIEWLQGWHGRLGPRQRELVESLIESLRARVRREYEAVREAVLAKFHRQEQKLRRELRVYRVEYSIEDSPLGPSFGEVAADRLLELLAETGAHLARVETPAELAEAHAARIRVKRLRYTLTPVADALPHGADMVREMKALQDVLGQLQDTVVLGEEIGRQVEAAGARRARAQLERSLAAVAGGAGAAPAGLRDPAAALLRLARRVKLQQVERFHSLQSEWLHGGRAARLVASLRAEAPRLAALGRA